MSVVMLSSIINSSLVAVIGLKYYKNIYMLLV